MDPKDFFSEETSKYKENFKDAIKVSVRVKNVEKRIASDFFKSNTGVGAKVTYTLHPIYCVEFEHFYFIFANSPQNISHALIFSHGNLSPIKKKFDIADSTTYIFGPNKHALLSLENIPNEEMKLNQTISFIYKGLDLLSLDVVNEIAYARIKNNKIFPYTKAAFDFLTLENFNIYNFTGTNDINRFADYELSNFSSPVSELSNFIDSVANNHSSLVLIKPYLKTSCLLSDIYKKLNKTVNTFALHFCRHEWTKSAQRNINNVPLWNAIDNNYNKNNIYNLNSVDNKSFLESALDDEFIKYVKAQDEKSLITGEKLNKDLVFIYDLHLLINKLIARFDDRQNNYRKRDILKFGYSTQQKIDALIDFKHAVLNNYNIKRKIYKVSTKNIEILRQGRTGDSLREFAKKNQFKTLRNMIDVVEAGSFK